MPGGKVPLDTCSYLTLFRLGSQCSGPIKSPAAEAAGLMTLFIIKRGNWEFGNQILSYNYYYWIWIILLLLLVLLASKSCVYQSNNYQAQLHFAWA